MKAIRINHRDEDRIKLEFPYNQELIRKIKQIEGCTWSQTHKAWHIPCTREAFNELKKLIPDVAAEGIFWDQEDESMEAVTLKNKDKELKTDVELDITARKIIVKMAKNDDDIRFISSLKYSRWNTSTYRWEIPNYPGNLDLINDYFHNRISGRTFCEDIPVKSDHEIRTVKKDEMLIIRTRSGRLKLIFGYDNDLSKKIKSFPFHSWDKKNKWWTIPFSEQILAEIRQMATSLGYRVLYEEEAGTEAGIKKVSRHDIPNYREVPEEYILKIKELRYSNNTLKIYKSMFEEFINYHFRMDID